MNSRALCLFCLSIAIAAGLGTDAVARESDEMNATRLRQMHLRSKALAPKRFGPAVAQYGAPIETLPNWNDYYVADGFDSNGNPNRNWYTNTVGNSPNAGKMPRGRLTPMLQSTMINAPIIPVIVDLREADGSPRFVNGNRLISSPMPFVDLVLQSPLFSNTSWASSPEPTQFNDAVQRAQFIAQAGDDWHTLLAPDVKGARTVTFLRGDYTFTMNPDGTCCQAILVEQAAFNRAMLPAAPDDTASLVGAAKSAGEITPQDITMFLFPNVFVYQGTTSNCCLYGYHSYYAETGDGPSGTSERRYVFAYASWISPGLVGSNVQDVTALSHELAEIINDPFVASDGVLNVTPWWLSGGNCQNTLETADATEGLARATFPVVMPNGYEYHPANQALAPWFKREFPSSALHGAYSFPDEGALPNLSDPERAGCQ
jgi:hypothetical protein